MGTLAEGTKLYASFAREKLFTHLLARDFRVLNEIRISWANQIPRIKKKNAKQDGEWFCLCLKSSRILSIISEFESYYAEKCLEVVRTIPYVSSGLLARSSTVPP